MKEERILESLFDKAREEKPKTAYKTVASVFMLGTAGTAMGGVNALLSKPIYLNGLIGLTVSAAVSSTVYVTNEANSNKDQAQNQIEFAEEINRTDLKLVSIPLLDEKIDEEKIFVWSPVEMDEIPEIGQTPDPVESSIGGVLYTEESAKTEERPEESELEEYDVVLSVPTNSINYLEPVDQGDEESEEDLVLRCSIQNDYTEKELKTFFNYLNYNGIEAEMKWNYNFAKDRIKKIVLEMSEGHESGNKIIGTDFETIELFWKLDEKGNPYDMFIVWDRKYDQKQYIGVTDELNPVYRYKGD